MPASLFRGDYEQLAQIAQRFAREQDAAQRMLADVQRQVNVLQGGDWVGEGATAFYAEMNGAVLPSLKRLVKALQSAQRVTAQISRAIKVAEDEAAAVLRDSGAVVTAPQQSQHGGGGIMPSFTQPKEMTWGEWVDDVVDWLLGRGKYDKAKQDASKITVTFSNGGPMTPTATENPAQVQNATPSPMPTEQGTQTTGVTVTQAPVATGTPAATVGSTTGVQFSVSPVPLTDNTFVNGFGPIQFAKDNQTGIYKGTSGLHGGIDLGVAGGTEVKAGVSGEVVKSPIQDAVSPGGHVVVKVGDKYVVYGHTEMSTSLKIGDLVTPETVLGKVYTWNKDAQENPIPDNSHIHLSVLEFLPTGKWRAYNPALLFGSGSVLPPELSMTVEGNSEIASYIYSGKDNYWDDIPDPDLGIVFK